MLETSIDTLLEDFPRLPKIVEEVDLGIVNRVLQQSRVVRDRVPRVFVAGHTGRAAAVLHRLNHLGEVTKPWC